ncbi:MAG TPA: polysaccharide deacetylase [Gammaproteobacteria bacterium]|nr:polysaccharide deacetylase [Gammaproteobacteria bacterium]
MRNALLAILLMLLGACRAVPETISRNPGDTSGMPPIRFLMTFDDGPSSATENNTTAKILDTLARNRWQKGVKAIFFVQTRHPRFGGTAVGQQLMRRMHDEGHLLGIHTATPDGHVSHVRMPLPELDRMLENGIADIFSLTGDVPQYLRPPFWAHNAATVARYEAHGLTLVLDDITLRDGKSNGYTYNMFARTRAQAHLQNVARQIAAGQLPVVSGYIPVIVTLHDPNPTTANDLEAYMGMLIEEAKRAGLQVDRRPFLSSAWEIMAAANARGDRSRHTASIYGRAIH